LTHIGDAVALGSVRVDVSSLPVGAARGRGEREPANMLPISIRLDDVR